MIRSHLIAPLLALSFSATQANALDLPLSHKGSGTLYVQTTLSNDQKTGWLVDTGSDHSVIDKASIDKLVAAGKAHYLKKLRGKMADGSERIIPLYVIDKLQLAEGCVVHDVKVAVLPKSTRNIMGLSVLRQLAPFSVSFDPPTLSVQGCQPSRAALQLDETENTAPKKKPPTQSAGGLLNETED